MFPDPQVVTVNAVAQSLPGIGTTLNVGKYRSPDRTYTLSISHNSGRRDQHRVRLDYSKIIVDPFASDRMIPVSMSTYLHVDVPVSGVSVAEMGLQVTALADWLKATTNTTRFVGGEI
jgi:hypothetical protein